MVSAYGAAVLKTGTTMRRHPEAFRLTALVGLLLIGLTAGCGRKHYLAQYSFTDR